MVDYFITTFNRLLVKVHSIIIQYEDDLCENRWHSLIQYDNTHSPTCIWKRKVILLLFTFEDDFLEKLIAIFLALTNFSLFVLFLVAL